MAGTAAHHQTADNGNTEWRVAVPAAVAEHENTKSSRLFSWAVAPMHRMSGFAGAAWRWLLSLAAAARDRVVGFARTVWKIGADDPRKVAHGFKMALALTLCSVFYYVQPLYVFTGHNAMWAVLTVVVVFEYTVGGCLYKGLNRAMATVTGGALALGVQWIASKSGKEFEPFILSGSLFVFASAATYSRFIPTMKARFDYGVTIFILTYTLVAVGGYRVNEVAFMAQHRLTTIAIGALICFAVCALIFPVWAGQQLHDQVARNMDKLAAAVESCVEDLFSEAAGVDASTGERPAKRALSEKSQGYRAVLNAKASEDSLANLARWEPAHGKFGFRHPYPLYQKIGAAMRCCAYCVDALAASVGSAAQTPAHVKKHLAGACAALSRHCATVLREASGSVATMTRSGRLALVVGDMNAAAQELRHELRCLAALLEEDDSSDTEHNQDTAAPESAPPLIEVLPLFSAASLLLEICTRAEGVVSVVDNLATTARFKKADHDEENMLDVEAAVPTAMSNALTAEVPEETHAKVAVDHEKTETAADQGSNQAPRDQVGELIKVLMRRRSTKKWARGDIKVCPKPPLDFVAHAPSPRSRSMELTGHAQVAPSPRHHRSLELGSHPPVAPSPRNRSMDCANHGPVVPSPRNRSMDFASNGPVLPSPRHRSILGMA
ncbi:Aluminum-activated malate transporter 10 [Dichanthelium oligosanthes]|uniref:Aluminum-activated malate transporter 10 n=1 Tax=Dichanthelium oligosanthes TaxID=888268 RepID=A0A1E5ULX7_9POAL|nr:Aluminum-activated malate transporter 10 [Dichanthelium oligosanthes]